MMEIASKAARGPGRLGGARVLVVEDDFLIALELAAILTDAGAEVVGPWQTVAEALAFADDETLSAAILDMRIGSGSVAPVARKLADHHVPFVFYTGQTRIDPLTAEWPNSQILSKPAFPHMIIAAVASLVDRPNSASAS